MSGGAAPAPESSGSGKNVFGETTPSDVTLNLTALMDILSNLLFFLLASFGATIVMAINASVPVQSADKSDVADTQQSVTVNIRLGKDKLEIVATGLQQKDEELEALKKTLAYDPVKPDLKPLTEYLVGVKEKYPTSDTIILTPEPGTQYEMMVRIMDSSREQEIRAGGRLRMTKLFPTVVISTLVK